MYPNRPSFFLFTCISGVLLFLCTVSLAGITGKIAGRVIDADTREILPGANVIIKAVIKSGETYEYEPSKILGASSDEDGEYQFIDLKPGQYQVRCQVLGGYVYYGVTGDALRVTRYESQAAELSTGEDSGDVLNTTARIQESCNKYKVDILISKETFDLIENSENFELMTLGSIELRGKERKVDLNTIKTT